MRRGEICTLQDKHYVSKARPVVVIQDDRHNCFDSVILCLLSTYESSDIETRVLLKASAENGLKKDSFQKGKTGCRNTYCDSPLCKSESLLQKGKGDDRI